MRTVAQLALILTLLTGIAEASWVDFEPIQATSPDGAIRVTAEFHGVTEWKNTAKTVPANGSMRYEMTDAKSNSVWVADVPIDAAFSSFDTPAELFIGTNAWTVARTHSSKLLCFSPDGERTANLDILDSLLPDVMVHGDFFYWTTAGRKWGQWYAHYYFLTQASEHYFVLRTYWDARLIIHLQDGVQATADERLTAALVRAEQQFVLTVLSSAAQSRELSGNRRELPVRPVMTAAHMAGRMGIEKAIPLLRELELLEYDGGWTRIISGPTLKPLDGPIDPNGWADLVLRQVAHLSLRRLGHTPKRFPCTHLMRKDSDPPEPVDIPRPTQPRDKLESLLGLGRTPDEVVRAIGAPDFIVDGTWEYDIDALEPHTLRLRWGEGGVKSIDRVRPAVWQKGNSRDLQILQ